MNIDKQGSLGRQNYRRMQLDYSEPSIACLFYFLQCRDICDVNKINMSQS